MENNISVGNFGKYFVSKIAAMPNRLKAAIICGAIVGFVTHILYITGTLINHDSFALMLNLSSSNMWQTLMMRWGFDFLLELFRLNQPSQTVNGILTVITLIILACFLIETLQIKNTVICCLVSCFTVTYPAAAATMLCGSSFIMALTLLFSAMGAYFAARAKNRFLNTVLPVILIFFAASTYQSYVGLACGLFLAVVICRSFSSEYSAKELIKSFFKYLFIIAASLIIYYIAAKAVLNFNNLQPMARQGVDSLSLTSNPLGYLKGLKKSYFEVYDVIIRDSVYPAAQYTGTVHGFKWLYRLIMLIGAFSFAVICFFKRKNLTLPKIILIIICAAALPPAVDLVRVASPDVLGYSIVVYPLMLFFILCLKFSDMAVIVLQSQKANLPVLVLSGIISWGTFLLGVSQVFVWYRYTNDKYTLMQYTYDATEKFSSNISEAIRNTPGFTKQTPVMLVFDYMYINDEVPEALTPLTDSINGLFYGNIFWYYQEFGVLESYLRMHYDEDYNWVADEETIRQIRNNPEFIEMPSYPNYGFTKEIDGVIVVKITFNDKK